MIRDYRSAGEWDPGYQPVTRKMAYDDLYRLTRINYEYPNGVDVWRDPYAAELSDNTRPQPAPRGDSGPNRPLTQSWGYDWLGNSTSNLDDTHGFYDRSLGSIGNTRYQLTSAQNGNGSLSAQYDAAGNMTELLVHRSGNCIPANAECHEQRYGYEWDEVGRLVRARRWDARSSFG
jgi:hypothetical protein